MTIYLREYNIKADEQINLSTEETTKAIKTVKNKKTAELRPAPELVKYGTQYFFG